MQILILSNHNAVRGPMAQALLLRALGGGFAILSAGHKGQAVHPMAVKAMQELGLDISGHVGRALRELDVLEVEMTINLCFGEPGPIVPGRLKRLDWPTPDPLKGSGDDEALLQRFRSARDALAKRADKLAAELKGAPTLAK